MKRHHCITGRGVGTGWPFLLVIGLLLVAPVGVSHAVVSYLTNNFIKVGIDTERGGTITYLAGIADGRDLINNFDLGRMVQQSYYSGPTPFGTPHPAYPNWGWNPVAAGDVYGYRSLVLQWTNDGTTLYIKRIPKNWALSNVDSECTMEEWITLEDNIAKVRCRLNNNRSDTNFYGGYGQELPALYANPPFTRIFTYNGASPFTGGALTQIVQAGPPWTSFLATESWSAMVDATNWGVGLYHPDVQYTLGGKAGTGSLPEGYTTGYLSPVVTEHLDHNTVYEYEYYLIVGSLADIRSHVYEHRPPVLPHWHFQRDRQHWVYLYTTDLGWPIEGKLRVNLNSVDPVMMSSAKTWNAADVPKLYIRAKYSAANAYAQLFWQNLADGGFGAKSMYLFLIPDGQYHTYVMNLSLSPLYTGAIKQLRFDPVLSGTAGEHVEIDYISAYPFPGDLNRDETVDFGDFAMFASHWGEDRAPGFVGDLDGDRKVDLNDLAVFTTYWLKSIEDHTKAHWKFDETNGVVAADETGINPGQLINFPTDGSQWVAGATGGALQFDGVNDYVSVAHHPSLDITHCITIAAWVKMSDLNTYNFIVNKQPSGTAGAAYPGNYEFRIAPGGKLEFLHQTDMQGTYQAPYTSTGSIVAGAWTHVAVTLIKGNQVRFYSNGTMSGWAWQSGMFGILNSEPVRIGTRKDAFTFFNGAMDAVQIYNRALNDEEIQALAQPLPP